MITLLFDIDGTLLRAGNAGMQAVHQSLVEMFGEVQESGLVVHGRTDHGIMTDVFAGIGRDYQQHRNDFDQLYWSKLPEVMAKSGGELLPGVLQLLEKVSAESDMTMGILTGNARAAAGIKLQHFGIEQYFAFGGYGDHHSDRNQVASLAVENARLSLGNSFDPAKVWVIGDTVNDIVCARSIGAKVVAVETGGGTRGELLEAEPDIVFKDLANHDEFLTVVRK